ncbi:MAG: ATP-binding protein [Candidatus Eisenbacteria bacterium]|uniref:ATP-binding protein n=1 Tax=Eiseniibacteriota bacterium TaxID=2212470 RepID=A0A956LVS8_UNCEI|nr:ATP-binding protein [Candidatus Eisenbacteria bacterium]
MAKSPPESSNGSGQNCIKLSIPSRLEYLGVLDQLVQAIAEQMDFDADARDAIANSVIEAATNAVQHGHQHQSDLPVSFWFEMKGDLLDIWVHDSGPGFDLDEVTAADPTGPEGLLRSRGRGIFIMRAMMDEVEFDIRQGEGVTVHMCKQVTPPSDPGA